MKKVWLLPKKLDRKYSFFEKFRHYFLNIKNVYDEDLQDYIPTEFTLYKRFNKEGYTYQNPYQSIGYFGGRTIHFDLESRYSGGGISTKVSNTAVKLLYDYCIHKIKIKNI
jgi:hypothetical protein